MTTMTAPERQTFAKSHEHIADARDALCNLEGCLYLLRRGRYVPNEAEQMRWVLDELDEAVRGLHELLGAESP